jgi:hypothetical protein
LTKFNQHLLYIKQQQGQVKYYPCSLLQLQESGGKRQLGIYSGKLKFHEDFDKLLPEDILNDFWPESEDDALST